MPGTRLEQTPVFFFFFLFFFRRVGHSRANGFLDLPSKRRRPVRFVMCKPTTLFLAGSESVRK